MTDRIIDKQDQFVFGLRKFNNYGGSDGGKV
jgi:hypothetical protein